MSSIPLLSLWAILSYPILSYPNLSYTMPCHPIPSIPSHLKKLARRLTLYCDLQFVNLCFRRKFKQDMVGYLRHKVDTVNVTITGAYIYHLLTWTYPDPHWHMKEIILILTGLQRWDIGSRGTEDGLEYIFQGKRRRMWAHSQRSLKVCR